LAALPPVCLVLLLWHVLVTVFCSVCWGVCCAGLLALGQGAGSPAVLLLLLLLQFVVSVAS
jgi:hypothetical protein